MSDLGSFEGVGPVAKHGVSFVTADSAAEKPELGARKVYKGEEYVFIHNAMASTELDAGEFLTTSGLSGYSLTNSTAAGADFPLAVVKHTSIPSGGYGWGLVRGLVDHKVATTLATGTVIGIGDNGVADAHVGGSFSTGVAIGKVLSSATSSSKALSIVKLFG